MAAPGVTSRLHARSMIAESAASRDRSSWCGGWRRHRRASWSGRERHRQGAGRAPAARRSDRVGAPFVAVNCAALLPGVLESELFGHERGAFTGALARAPAASSRRRRHAVPRRDRRALGSTPGQAAARAAGRRFSGSARRRRATSTCAWSPPPTATCATRSPAGRFREDLYYRLNVVPIPLPPLRERREDILPLARTSSARHAERPLALSAEAEARLLAHDWPGNVRELENAIERAAILARGETLEPEDLLLEPGPSPVGAGGAAVPKADAAGGIDRANDFLRRPTRCRSPRWAAPTARCRTPSIAPPRSGCAARCSRPRAAAPKPRVFSASSARRSIG